MSRPRAVSRSALAGLAVVLIAACSPLVEGAARLPAPPATRAAAPVISSPRADVDAPADAERAPAPVPVAASRAAPAEPVPQAPAEPFAMNLFEEGDFVAQYTFEWCVAASVQMTWNMVSADLRTARGDQQLLWERARDLSHNPYGGADPGGWADLLNELGIGPYELVSVPEYDEALLVAAQAMRDTNHPVGLVMWRGRHAWVMSGFASMGDPAAGDFTVTGVRVVDPLYPYGNGTWGPSPQLNELISPDDLAKQFVFREQRRWSAHIPSGFLLVLPVAPELAEEGDVTGGPGSRPRLPAFEAL